MRRNYFTIIIVSLVGNACLHKKFNTTDKIELHGNSSHKKSPPEMSPRQNTPEKSQVHPLTTTESPNEESPIMTNDDIISLLTSRGFRVKNFTDDPPLALVGDIAYYPQQVLPELGSNDDRSNVQNKRLWVDASGAQQVWYYFDQSTQADKDVFHQAVATWQKSSCIKFEQQAPGACSEDRGHGAICVGNFGGCWSLVGNSYNGGWQKTSQKMSVQPDGCEMVAAAHELGHGLGLQHQQARDDRDQYIFTNYHNLDIKLSGDLDNTVKQAWNQAASCSAGQTVKVPIPYDFLSIMQYGASDFAEEDGRVVYGAKDPHHQYMMDYHRNAGTAQTHYDKLVINTAYKCTNLWRNTCKQNGNVPAKCLNGGYVTSDCKCSCADGYSGSACGSKVGPLYPVKDRAKTMLDIQQPGKVELADKGMHLKNNHYILKDFVYFQFVTVAVKTGYPRQLANIRVHQPFDAIAEVMASRGAQDFIMQNIAIADCEMSGFFYWGASAANQLRTECITSLFNNELPAEQLNLRGRNRTLDIVAIGFLGRLFHRADTSMRALELTLDIEFAVNAAKQLRTFKTPADDPGPLGDPMADGGKPSAGVIAGIVIAVIVVVALLVGLVWAWKSGKIGP
ncbi:uncharacterized protein LOC119095562 [Pollicipes pollicipes]|uniref:uncharacterized protein LOC119095562 n=1 Tax=Pollicipes pollicipes TaxID=41117 RepID=UPI0018851990|nr:uncharacterized protein LOC119095562 [Pollicipes pollicipes]